MEKCKDCKHKNSYDVDSIKDCSFKKICEQHDFTMYQRKMNSLDILLCAGKGRYSRIIQRANKIAGYEDIPAEISHVALVLEHHRNWLCSSSFGINPVAEVSSDSMFVFEATTLNWNGKRGVQINPYDQWLKNYPGKVWVRHVDCTPPDGVAEWMAKQVGRPYENGLGGFLELITVYLPMNRTVVGKWVAKKMKTIEPHCGEIGGECLQYFGRMTNKVNTSKLPPPLWAGDGLDSILNCRVDKMERIK